MPKQISCVTRFHKLYGCLSYQRDSEDLSEYWNHQCENLCVDEICSHIINLQQGGFTANSESLDNSTWYSRDDEIDFLKDYLYLRLSNNYQAKKSTCQAISFFLSQGGLKDVQMGLSLYEQNPLYYQQNLSGEALHSLGDAQLSFEETDDISCFDEACAFYFLAYQKGHKKSFTILLNFLVDEAFRNRPLIRRYFIADNANNIKENDKLFAQELLTDYIFKKKKSKAPWLTEEVFCNYLLKNKEEILGYTKRNLLDASYFFFANTSKKLKNLIITHYYSELNFLNNGHYVDDAIRFLNYKSKYKGTFFLTQLTDNQKLVIQSAASEHIIDAIRLRKKIDWNKNVFECLLYPCWLGFQIIFVHGISTLLLGYEETYPLPKNRNLLLMLFNFLIDTILFSISLLLGLSFIGIGLAPIMIGFIFKINQLILENKYQGYCEKNSAKCNAEDTEKMLYFYHSFFSTSGYDNLEKESDVTLSFNNRENYKLKKVLDFQKAFDGYRPFWD